MAEVIMVYARWRQPLIMASLVIAGATGPVTLAGSLAQQNAEVLAGIVLTQIVSPGTPVIYASASTNMDLRTGSLAIGSPELSLMSAVSIQLATFYDIPSRGGGALTDSNSPDAQAGYESMFALLNAARSGSDFILHSAGILSSFLAFSYEKFVLDDDMCGMVRHFHKGISVEPDTLAYDVIAKVGPGSNYLREPHTVERCRSAFWQPAIADRDGVEMWMVNGRGDALKRAKERWQQLLYEHRDPEIDPVTRRQLKTYLDNHCS
jgi:trimethylamine--corrinoid protein Co-methyltransferase